MLCLYIFNVIFVSTLITWQLTNSQRRIKNGILLAEDNFKGYMVYLTKAAQSDVKYDAWICGGAIVTQDFIVTSAACVEDVKYMYAIAGYHKYVKVGDIATNQCTKASRKKVVFTCVPKTYQFEYEKIQKWSYIDIAAVKVESSYNFKAAPLPGCSYAPDKISINYDPEFQRPKLDALVLGWGHDKKWRTVEDTQDYNTPELMYSTIKLLDKKTCKESYADIKEMDNIIDKYMICAFGDGNINDQGNPIVVGKAGADSCKQTFFRVGGVCRSPINYKRQDEQDAEEINKEKVKLEYQYYQEQYQRYKTLFEQYQKKKIAEGPPLPPHKPLEPPESVEKTPASIPETTSVPESVESAETIPPPPMESSVQPKDTETTETPANPPKIDDDPSRNDDDPPKNDDDQPKNDDDPPNIDDDTPKVDDDAPKVEDDDITFDDVASGMRRTRRSGICQNDHGGPLVTWVGKNEILIGVASVFRLSKSGECIGPFLFTSTQCNSAFLDCVIHEGAHLDDLRTSQYGAYRRHDEKSHMNRTNRSQFRRSDVCDLPPETLGFEFVKRRISWVNHPDGPAENELNEDLFHRPQQPLHDLRDDN